jgi:diguanylate cyclase (GGDEF)-like protein
LAEWGSAGVNDSKAKADEFRELLLVLAKTAGIIGSNNNVFSQQFTDLTLRLAKIANIGDLTEMRSSLVKSVGEIKESIEQIARESRELIAHLNEKVTTFESIAFKDDLTGLDNRRSIQERIRRLIKEQHIFCVVMIDLNRFKPINDEFGHIVGDELLRKFADRLREVTRLNDLVGRTGGDEFVAVLSCGIAGAEQYVSRLRESVFGRYTIHPRQDKITLDLLVNAAVGVALWQRSEDADQLLGRADAAMYANKRTTRGDLS